MPLRSPVRRATGAIPLLAVLALAGCGGSSSGAPSSTAASPRPAASAPGTTTPGPAGTPASSATSADRAFVRHMLVHHRRAIAVGRLAQQRGTDPRVRAFGSRIVREQTPEERRLSAWVHELGVRTAPGDAAMASGYVTDGEFDHLRTAAPRAFDREVLLASARSETGAAAMAAEELRGGRYAPARDLARSIATAPTGEIPQLRALAAGLPR